MARLRLASAGVVCRWACAAVVFASRPCNTWRRPTGMLHSNRPGRVHHCARQQLVNLFVTLPTRPRTLSMCGRAVRRVEAQVERGHRRNRRRRASLSYSRSLCRQHSCTTAVWLGGGSGLRCRAAPRCRRFIKQVHNGVARRSELQQAKSAASQGASAQHAPAGRAVVRASTVCYVHCWVNRSSSTCAPCCQLASKTSHAATHRHDTNCIWCFGRVVLLLIVLDAGKLQGSIVSQGSIGFESAQSGASKDCS